MRYLTNWIDSYMQMVKETEPHPRYHLWVAITIVASALGRKCEIQLGPELLFPNFYTVLVGPPGNRKSTAIRYCAAIAEESGVVKIAPAGRVTDQQLYIELADSIKQEVLPSGQPFIHHTMLVIASELVIFLGESKGGSSRTDNRMGDICDLYDNTVFTNRTKHQGSDFIVNPGLYLLGATTPSWIINSMPMLAIGGGPTSRILFVYSDSLGKKIPATQLKPFDPDLREKLVLDLQDIGKLCGQFTITPDAAALHEEWYINVHPTINLQDSRLDPYLARMPIIVIKTAMVLSAARSSSMVIEADDILMAIKMLNSLNKYMGRSFGLLGYNQLGAQTDLVRNLIESRGSITRAEILSTLRMHINKWDYERILETLLAEGFCTSSYCNGQFVVKKV